MAHDESQTFADKVRAIPGGEHLVINTATALLFFAGRKKDLNIRGAYLHMASDAGVSVGVVLAGIGIMTTGWLWIDPLVSLVIVAIGLLPVMYGTETGSQVMKRIAAPMVGGLVSAMLLAAPAGGQVTYYTSWEYACYPPTLGSYGNLVGACRVEGVQVGSMGLPRSRSS